MNLQPLFTNLLHDLAYGEIALLSTNENPGADRYLLRVLRLYGLGFTPRIITVDTPDLHHIIAVRRPLLQQPQTPSFAVANIDSLIPQRVESLLSTLSDVIRNITEEHPRPIEYINPAPLTNSQHAQPKPCYSMSLGDEQLPKKKLPPIPLHKMADGIMEVSADPEEEEEENEPENEFELDNDRKAWLDALTALVLDYVAKYHTMPPMEKLQTIIAGKLSLSETGISPVVVNRDMRIILPDYNEMELRMTPLARTVYILFLCHPEGIALKQISDYRKELEDIYLLVKPNASERNASRSIHELTIPGSDSLRQKISMTRRAVNRHILSSAIAKNYHICGTRGGEYKIAGLTKDMINLPAALTNR